MKLAPIKYDPALLDSLTGRERAFIEHPLVLKDAVKAAVDSGYSETWAKKNAHSKRKQLMYYILPEVHKRWDAKGISLERIYEELACIAFADETAYYEKLDDDVTGGERFTGKDPKLLPEGMRRAIQQIHTETIVVGENNAIQFLSFTLHDKKVALKMLAELLGGFDPRTREPADAEAARLKAALFDFMTQDEFDTIVKIYRRAEERQKKAAIVAEPIQGEKA